MNEEYIPIPKDRLEQTKLACGQTLLMTRTHQECNMFKNIIHFLIDESRHYLLFLLIGLLFVLTIKFIEVSAFNLTLAVGVYFAVMAFISFVEFYKNTIYKIDELLATTMIRPHQIIMYKTIGVMLLEFLAFFIIGFFVKESIAISIFKLFVYIMLPIMMTNALALVVSTLRYKPVITVSITMGVYTIISLLFFEYRIANHLNVITLGLVIVTIIIIFIMLIRIGIYRKKRGYTYGTYN